MEESKLELNKEFWDNRYLNDDTGWDVGTISTPIKEYIDQLNDRSLKILIPGCGNAHEAEYLHQKGFNNVYLIDLSPTALDNFSKRVPDFPKEHLICGNFFEHEDQYDIIIEQTFFCAIDVELRPNYAQQVAKLLKPTGKLVGLLFSEALYVDHPPYGGTVEEYETYFKPLFNVEVMDPCYNSIEPRANREVFIKMTPK